MIRKHGQKYYRFSGFVPTIFVAMTFVAMTAFGGCSSVVGRSRLVTGFVQTLATDQNDYPVEAYIWDGHTEYRLTENKKKHQLLELIDRKVAVRGSVFNDWNGKTQIEVESFEVLDEK